MSVADHAPRSRFSWPMPRDNLAASLYGTVLVSSVLVALKETERAGWAIAAVVVTAGVFTLAHAWAHALVNVGLLFAWGVGLRRAAGGGLAISILGGLSASGLGLLLVALKALIH